MQNTETTLLPQGNTAQPVVRGANLADLTRLYEPEVMLVTAPLPADGAALAHAEAMARAGPRSSQLQVATPDGDPAARALDQLALAGEPGARAWGAYLEGVTAVFAELLGAHVVGVRQVVANGPHCPRFHVDQVVARGVLTVLGARTEWLDDRDADRTRLGHAGGPDDATSGLVRRWDRLGRAECGELAIFKGTACPHASERAIVHRSPPSDGSPRVVLTLDWME
ncbi:MAG: DUF1826 domain-containing protein [Planctomycetota bacterium]